MAGCTPAGADVNGPNWADTWQVPEADASVRLVLNLPGSESHSLVVVVVTFVQLLKAFVRFPSENFQESTQIFAMFMCNLSSEQ